MIIKKIIIINSYNNNNIQLYIIRYIYGHIYDNIDSISSFSAIFVQLNELQCIFQYP